jgi:trehalose 6-phosphate synthase
VSRKKVTIEKITIEEDYYLGFFNEGLWPLWHIAHTRPTFRSANWQSYKEVNSLFADALLEEMAEVEHPVVIVQDYHFATLATKVAWGG